MSMNLTLPSEHDASDLSVFLERAAKLGCEHVRLIGAGPALAAYVGVLVPSGLLDTAPTVLGLRVVDRGLADEVYASDANPEHESFLPVDTVVTIRGMLDRLARPELSFALPVGEAGIAWAGVSAPRSGWEALGSLSATDLEAIARSGIDEIAGSNGLGTIIVTRARREVWGRAISSNPELKPLVAGAAFAAFGLGFLGEDEPVLSRFGKWLRVTTSRGHILVR
jgi:hypothetical protein